MLITVKRQVSIISAMFITVKRHIFIGENPLEQYHFKPFYYLNRG